MQIVVTITDVVDSSVPLEIDPERQTALREEGVARILNPADRAAIEVAAQLKERSGGRVTAVTLGPASTEAALRQALAGGADAALRLWDDAFSGSDSRAIALILASAVRQLEPDLVLCGRRSLDGDSGVVPPTLAELLSLPFVGGVTKLEIDEGKREATVQRAVERGDRELLRCSLPVVLAVDDAIATPRYPELPELLAALRAPIEARDMGALGLARRRVGQMGSLSKLVALVPPRPRPKKLFTPDSSLSAEERMQLILSGGVGRKQGDLIEGPPDDVAGQLVRFLEGEGLL